MIWLASYPRSGNTFLRVILDEVYGIESSAYPVGPNKRNKPEYNYLDFRVIKTHLLPDEVDPPDKDIPAVLLVRDGRDSVVSYAHFWKSFEDPQTDFYDNLKGIILAGKRSKFVPGWSTHVDAWMKRASLVIKFEDLITNPIQTVEQLRSVMDLPEPDTSNLPTFQDLRTKRMRYGNIAARRSEEVQEKHRKKFFRKGKTGAWKEEMPEELHELFWLHHGAAMDRLGYEEGRIDFPVYKKILAKSAAQLYWLQTRMQARGGGQ